MFLSILLLFIGQTVALFDYDLTVRLGFQEAEDKITGIGVAVNKAFGAGDTLVYIPLLAISLSGLYRKRRWSLITTGGVAGISAYWTVTSMFGFKFLENVESYNFTPGTEYWIVMIIFLLFGVVGLFYLIARGERLIQ